MTTTRLAPGPVTPLARDHAPEARRPDDRRARIVVVGNGMSGARAVEEILARGAGEEFAITVFGDEPYGNYNRILLSEVLTDAAEDRASPRARLDDELFLNPRGWYDENGVTLHAGVRVVRIDRRHKRVHGDDGSLVAYDTLILATGSRSFFPPMDGMWAGDTELTPGVFGFRSLDDVAGVLRHVTDKRSAVVIGGGLLGLEAAAGLQAHGLNVHVVHPSEVLMDQQLHAEASAVLRATLQGMGMNLHLGARASEILTGDDGAVAGVRFADGSTLHCDTVVVTAGVRPNVGLATACGLPTRRAVLVDDQMRSVDDDDVYVVGECAEHRGEVYGVVGPLWEQASVLADVVTGANPRAEYRGSRLATKLKVAGVEVAQMGVKTPEREGDELVQFCDTGRGVHQTLVIRDGTLAGATLVGDVSRAAALVQAIDSGSALPAERVRLLFDLGPAADAPSAAELPDDTRICHCHRVSKADLVRCVHDGAGSVAACMATTRAGTGCGSCRGLVAEVVAAARGGEDAAERGLDPNGAV